MTKPRFAPILGTALAAAGLLAGIVPGALAQQDPSTQQIIERLTPPAATRGIRVPGAGDAPAAQPPVQPAPVFPDGRVAPATPLAPPVVAGPATPPPMPAMPVTPVAPVAQPQPPRMPAAPAIDLPIYFPSGSWAITPQAERQLAELGRALVDPRLANFRFRLEGHTDTVGAAMMNQALSERRAAAVRDYLMRNFGVGAERLHAIGLGESQPAVPTRDETPEPRNRRVRVVNLDG
ncbi:MAG TPA: OmpA family protein [Acetobacteraceae bacterium]|nr:OmpA family protein [Acetobacteraceae bacterium]